VGTHTRGAARFPIRMSSVGYPDVTGDQAMDDLDTKASPGEPASGLSEGAQRELADELAAMQDELARTPASIVVANHAIGLFQLAAIHLNRRPPNLEEGRLAIDAFAGLVDATQGRLGDEEDTLRAALSQIRLAFVTLTRDNTAEPLV
jgi:hypothetical protein